MSQSSEIPEKAQLVIIGAGPGGYAAAFRAVELGRQVTLIDPEANPGGVCLHRGCIPSKALLHVAKLVTGHRDSWRSVDQIAELTMPALLINGRWEKAFQATLDEVRDKLGNLEIVDLEGGHAINIEQAAAFDAALLAFAADHRN